MAPRIFLSDTFAAAQRLELPAAAVRHVHALRLQPGDAIALFNGSDDAEWPASIVEIGRSRVVVRVGGPVPVARELDADVTLAIGMPANDRMDALVEKAGELGAAAIRPLVCARSVLRLAGERAEARRRHWQAVAAAASEQCGRVRVTALLPIVTITEWLGSADAGAGTRIVLSLSPSALAPDAALERADAAARTRAGGAADPTRRQIVVLSGPEGGLAADEEDAAVARGFVRVGLGPRVLRADTAPLAWLAWFGLRDAHPAEAPR